MIKKKNKILTVALGNKYMWVQYTFLSAFVCVWNFSNKKIIKEIMI